MTSNGMNLLICTQAVDTSNSVLGFFHRWIIAFAREYTRVHVICLEEGRHRLPENVRVHSLGKEVGTTKLQQVGRFYSYIWKHRYQYDAVFVHMNPEYVVLGGLLWRLLRKRVGLWYTHRAVHWKLRIAEKLSHVVFSASGASFRLPSEKLHVLNHGIDTKSFQCPERARSLSTPLRIVVVGRITPIKGSICIVEATNVLKEKGFPFILTFIGEPTLSTDTQYAHELDVLIKERGLEGQVLRIGSIPNEHVGQYYCGSDIALNMVPTGGIDKTVLEAMAAGTIPLTSNEAFREYFSEYVDVLTVPHNDPPALARQIESVSARNDIAEIRSRITAVARERFDVDILTGKIWELLSE